MSTSMGRKIHSKLADSLCRRCHFCKEDVEKLLVIYTHLTTIHKRLDRSIFRDVLHNNFDMTDDILMDRVFRAFDKDNDGVLNEEEFVFGLSVFLLGNLEEKVSYCFKVYDLNNDGHIQREEMFQLLKNSMVKQTTEEDPDEGIKDLVELMLKKMDHDHDNRLSMDDYKKSVTEEYLLLEAFGPCLPTKERREKFLQDLENDCINIGTPRQ